MNSIGKIENRTGDKPGFEQAVHQAVRYYKDAERDLRVEPNVALAANAPAPEPAVSLAGYHLAEIAGAEGMVGRWAGPGADSLGLHGGVDERSFTAVLQGRDPRTGEELGQRTGHERVVAFDVAFSVPKSVSLLYAVTGQDRVREVILRALWEGGQASGAYLQDHAAWARRYDRHKHKVIRVRAHMVQAQFVHRLARPVRDPQTGEASVDPQLHLHTIIPARVRRDDGHWSHLYSEPLYDHVAAAGAIGQAVVRDILVRELGVEVDVNPNGTFELRGISEPQRREFSRRSQQIDAAERAIGADSLLGHKIAVEDSRQSKDEIDEMLLRRVDVFGEIRRRAVGVGLKPEDADALIDKQAQPNAERGLDASPEAILGAQGLTREAATFARRHVIRALATHAPLGGTRDQLEEMTDRVLADPTLVCRLDPELRLAGGEALPQALTRWVERGMELRFSTPEMLHHVEHRMLRMAEARAQAGAGVATVEHVKAAIASAAGGDRPGLTEDQKAMIQTITLSAAGTVVIEGAAGVGKTTALHAAREALEASGAAVVGCALAGRWAEELQQAAGIGSYTLASLLAQLEIRPMVPNTVLVIDEAGMVGSRQICQLVDIAARDKAKLVLIGDPKQLQPIDGGAGFRALGERIGKTVVRENVRQLRAPEWQRLAAAALRQGQGQKAFQLYLDHGGVRVAETAWQRKQQMVADYAAATERGLSAIMMARSHADVDDLNQLARATSLAQGWTGGPELEVAGRPYAVGDHVLCLRNHRRTGLTNGLRGQVVEVDPAGNVLTLEVRHGQRLHIDAEKYPHLDYGYAVTKTKSLGATADVALEMASEGASAEETYVGITRQRQNAIYYVVGRPKERDPGGVHHSSLRERTVEERYLRAWTRWEEKDSTLDYPGRYVELEAAAEASQRRRVAPRPMGPASGAQRALLAEFGGSLNPVAGWVDASVAIDHRLGSPPGEQALRWLQADGMTEEEALAVVEEALERFAHQHREDARALLKQSGTSLPPAAGAGEALDIPALAHLWSAVHLAWLNPESCDPIDEVSLFWPEREHQLNRLLEQSTHRQLEVQEREELGILLIGAAVVEAGEQERSEAVQPEDILRYALRRLRVRPANRGQSTGKLAEAAPAEASVQAAPRAGVALLLNDREEERITLAAILEAEGYTSLTTASLGEAAHIAKRDDLTLAVIDWRLSNSWEATSWVLENDPVGFVPEPTSAPLLRLLAMVRPALPVVVHSPDPTTLQIELMIERQHPDALVIHTARAAVELPAAIKQGRREQDKDFRSPHQADRLKRLLWVRERRALTPGELRELRAHLALTRSPSTRVQLETGSHDPPELGCRREEPQQQR